MVLRHIALTLKLEELLWPQRKKKGRESKAPKKATIAGSQFSGIGRNH